MSVSPTKLRGPQLSAAHAVLQPGEELMKDYSDYRAFMFLCL